MCVSTTFSLFIFQDGSVYHVGNARYGVSGDNFAVSYFSARPSLTQARKSDNSFFTDAVSVECGETMVTVLTSGGIVYMFGKLRYNTVTITSRGVIYANGMVEIASGSYHVLSRNGTTAFVFGKGINGQLGLGDWSDVWSFKPLTTLPETVSRIFAGRESSFILTTSNRLYVMGDGSKGTIGLGNWLNVNYPTLHPLLNVKSVASSDHTLVIDSNNTLWSFGANTFSQLGINSITDSNMPIKLNISGVSSVAVGPYHSLAIVNDQLFSWGLNDNGALCHGDIVNRTIPTKVLAKIGSPLKMKGGFGKSMILNSHSLLACGFVGDYSDGRGLTVAWADFNNMKDICVHGSSDSMIYLTHSGILYGVGNNHYCQLGLGTQSYFDSPTQITGLAGTISKISCGSTHTMVLTTGTSRVYTFGSNTYGQIGKNNQDSQCTPYVVTLPGTPLDIAAAPDRSQAVTTSGLYCWGLNDMAQCGTSVSGSILTPYLTLSGSSFIAICAGDYHGVILANNGDTYSYGSAGAALGQGVSTWLEWKTPTKLTTITGISKIACGRGSSFWLQGIGSFAGRVWASGGSGGILGLGDATMRIWPTLISLTGVVDIAAAGDSASFLTSTGSHFVTGVNSNSYLGMDDLEIRLSPTLQNILEYPVVRSWFTTRYSFVLTCPNGYYSQTCSGTIYSCGRYLASDSTNVCSGRGTCSGPNICTNCASGWGGAYCDVPYCYGVLGSNTSFVCSGRGSCVFPDICSSCSVGYGGSNCHLPICFGLLSNNTMVCSSRGVCAAPNLCASCLTGYTGSNCQNPICSGKPSDDPNVCSGRGLCTLPNKCISCEAGWTGDNCEIPICNGIPDSDPNVCNGHGQCIAPDSCKCDVAWGSSQDWCRYPKCFSKLATDANVCSGRGSCISPDVCNCLPGSSSGDCSQFTCFGVSSQSTLVCSEQGTCVNLNQCVCKNGWINELCNVTSCFGIASNDSLVCSGRGRCQSPDGCACDPGFANSVCSFDLSTGAGVLVPSSLIALTILLLTSILMIFCFCFSRRHWILLRVHHDLHIEKRAFLNQIKTLLEENNVEIVLEEEKLEPEPYLRLLRHAVEKIPNTDTESMNWILTLASPIAENLAVYFKGTIEGIFEVSTEKNVKINYLEHVHSIVQLEYNKLVLKFDEKQEQHAEAFMKLWLLKNSLNCCYKSSFGNFIAASFQNALKFWDKQYRHQEFEKTIEKWYAEYIHIKYSVKNTADQVGLVCKSSFWQTVYFSLDFLSHQTLQPNDLHNLDHLKSKFSTHPLLVNKLYMFLGNYANHSTDHPTTHELQDIHHEQHHESVMMSNLHSPVDDVKHNDPLLK